MRFPLPCLILAAILTPGLTVAQPFLVLKTRRIDTTAFQPVTEIRSPGAAGSGHVLLQFNDPPTPETIAELTRRGVTVLQDMPENGLLVSVSRRVVLGDLGARFAAPLQPGDKLSPLIASGGFFLAEFHPDVDLNDARRLVLDLGLELHEHPDLSAHHLMVYASDAHQLIGLAQLDEVAYLFPASAELAQGLSTRACAGALTVNGPTAQSIPTYGEGWDGPGTGTASLSYVYSQVTAQLPAAAAQAEVERAMAEWSKAVKVAWNRGMNPNGRQTVSIVWAAYSHGDGYPFDGRGGVLAHTFYPSPPNPEPIAGDLHFDDSESWRIGANTDLFSVALHELGHALGLGHADDPNAVMYPYYRMVTGLSPLDIRTAQTLYAAQDGAPSTPPTVLTLVVNPPPATTSAPGMILSGTTAGGAGAISVTWATDHGASGTAQSLGAAWTISSIPLAAGANTIIVTATDNVSHVSQSVIVTRQAAAPPSDPRDLTAPSLAIASPAATTVSTSATAIAFSGTATDNVGVTAVTWSTNTGASGTAVGTTQWAATIPLLIGSNTVTVRAIDGAGNIAWRTVIVSRR